METEYHDKRPQKDVPVEQIIHYIVKDYQRMFTNYEQLEKRALKAEAKVDELKEKQSRQLSKKDKEIEQLKEQIEALEKKNAQYLEHLEEMNRQKAMLANAIAPTLEEADPLELYQKLGSTIYIAELETKVEKQLNSALIRLSSATEQLKDLQKQLGSLVDSNAEWHEMKPYVVKTSKVFSKMESAKQLIDNFYKLALGFPSL